MLSLTPAVDYPTVANPVAIVAADFNGDGRLDLATANSTIGVMLGKSDGTFHAAQITNSPASSLAVGDFNADGKLDLAVTGGAGLCVLRGNGDGTFQAPTSILLSASPTSVAVGDFNNDGKLDLGVTTNTYYPGGSGYYGGYPGFYYGRANVLLGNGDGSFAAPTVPWLDGGYLSAPTLADFNGDGKLDFAMANNDSGNVIVLPGNGAGAFGSPSYSAASFYIRSMAVGDINGDGKSDLVTASLDNGNNVGVLLGKGDGSFQASQFYSSGPSPLSIALGDVNGDGALDIVTASTANSTVDVMLGAAGTFRPPVSLPTGTVPYGVVTRDFNGDGRLDVATANAGGNSVSVLLNDGNWPATNLPTVSIASLPDIAEGNTGTTRAVFTVSLSSTYTQPVTVQYTTVDGSATAAGGDYQAKSGTLTFAPGQTTQTITVLVNGDRVVESSEMFSVKLSNPTNAFLGNATGYETIQNDEPYVSIGLASSLEGNTGTTPMDFTVTLSAATDGPVSVAFATADMVDEWGRPLGAIAGLDYQAASGVLTFAPGETSKTITVLINGDRTPSEFSDYFYVNLGIPDGAGLAIGQAWGEILDDEPHVTIGQASVVEGNSGTTPLVFTVSLSATYDAPVNVTYTTIDGIALAGVDYTSTSGTLTFAPGEVTKTVSVLVKGDTLYEGDEFFYLNLVESDSGTIDYGSGVGSIVDDDNNTPQISISDVSKQEGNSGKSAFVFTVSLSTASSSKVTVNYATANGSATANGDYQATSGAITFAPGQTSKSVTVQVKGDTTTESDEYFVVNLSGAKGATIVDSEAVGTIIDDDVPKIRISDVSKKEGDSGTTSFIFTVSLSTASASQVTVNYATANGTAKVGDNDYDAKNGKLTFAPGETSKTITILVHGDKRKEANETFFVNLGNAKGALIDDSQGRGTITNDDKARESEHRYAISWAAINEALDDFLWSRRPKHGR